MSLSEMARCLRPRPADAHKGVMGHALLVAGSRGIAGCALLAGEALLRSGAGKLTVVTPEENRTVLQTALPEAITRSEMPLPLTPYQAVGVGPGIGLEEGQGSMLRTLLREADAARIPVVVDGDALRLLVRDTEITGLLANSVLTPHGGEMEALRQGLTPDCTSLEASAQRLSSEFGAVVVLKGHPSQVFLPNGSVHLCPRGNSGMATAGSGDVLTGLITGLLAQGYWTDEAAQLGVWLHASAGDEAARELGPECMLARDIIRHLPQAFAECREQAVQS